MKPDVVVTGIGAVTPLGVGAQTLIERWAAGESGIEDGFGRCLDFDPLDFLSKKEARRADRFTQLGLAASDAALADAGWGAGLPYDADRIGCVIGTGIGGIGTMEDQHDTLRDPPLEQLARSAEWRHGADAGDDDARAAHGTLASTRSITSPTVATAAASSPEICAPYSSSTTCASSARSRESMSSSSSVASGLTSSMAGPKEASVSMTFWAIASRVAVAMGDGPFRR